MTLRIAAITALVVTVVLGIINRSSSGHSSSGWTGSPIRPISSLRDPRPPRCFGGRPPPTCCCYLSTAIVALALWHVLRPRSPALADVATLGALGYVLAGSIGAVALAMPDHCCWERPPP